MTVPTTRWPKPFMAALALGALSVVIWRSTLFGAEAPVVIAPPAFDSPKASGIPQTAVLAGGCFWGVQGVFEHVRGVPPRGSGQATASVILLKSECRSKRSTAAIRPAPSS